MKSTNDTEKYVGIDVSKEQLDTAIGQEGKVWTSANTSRSIPALVRRLAKLSPELVVVESTGGLERPLVKALQQAQIPVAIVHPGRVRKFAAGIGLLAKTDRLDARLLARFAHAARPAPRPAATPAEEALSALVRRRSQLVDMRTSELNRRSSCLESMLTSIDVHLAWLNEHIDELDSAIELLVTQTQEFQPKAKIIRSTKGVGPVTTATLLAELPELGKFEHKELAALVGVAPFNKDSGRRSKKRRIKDGRFRVRKTLYMATLSAIRSNPRIKAHYDQLLARGKLRMVALVACMHKLLIILNAMVRDLRPWRADFAPQNT